MVFCKLPEIGNVHLDELYVFHPDKTDIAHESLNYRCDELVVSENIHTHGGALRAQTLLVTLLALQVAVVQDQIKQVDNVNLHCMITNLNVSM